MADKEPDTNKVVCKQCLEPKFRIRAGNFGGRTPRWLGDDGLLWNGKVCGKCHRKQTAARVAIKRAMNK